MDSKPNLRAKRPRRTPRPPRKWLYPAAIEREYIKSLESIADTSIKAVREHVIPALSSLRGDDLEHTAESDGWYDAIRLAFESALAAAAVTDDSVNSLVKLVQGRVGAFNRRQFQQVLRSAYGVDLFVREPNLLALMRVWEAENLKLIKSIPVEYLSRLEGRIVNAVQRGKSLKDVTALVKDSYPLPTSRAELIAKDQIGKLNGRLTRQRQTSIGVKTYDWHGVLDDRERDEHVAREGKEFSWDDPPEDGHPGEAIKCRCWAAAKLPLFDDLDALIIH